MQIGHISEPKYELRRANEEGKMTGGSNAIHNYLERETKKEFES